MPIYNFYVMGEISGKGGTYGLLVAIGMCIPCVNLIGLVFYIIMLIDFCKAYDQGAGMAIEDAAVVARCLMQTDAHAAAFALYEASRTARIREVQRILYEHLAAGAAPARTAQSAPAGLQ